MLDNNIMLTVCVTNIECLLTGQVGLGVGSWPSNRMIKKSVNRGLIRVARYKFSII